MLYLLGTSLSKHTSQNKAQSLIKTFSVLSSAYTEAKKLKINLLFPIGYTILDTFYSKFARRMKMITQFYM